MDPSIPSKANRVLNLILLGLLLILIRVWYLAIIQHDAHVYLARKPQRKSVIEKVERATIRDRFNLPLALNKIQYNAAVCYADIRQIPSVRWVKGGNGVRTKVYARTAYIKELSELLAQELDMEAQEIEDTIHGKASLFPHTPFVIKENLTEAQFFRLKFLEKDWVGIRTDRGSVRTYPMGKTGADIIGYLGAISSHEYLNVAQEIKLLQSYVTDRESGEMPFLPKGYNNPLEVRERLKHLQEKSYTINDLVGKTGIEAQFDEELRGYYGKQIHEVDIKGNFLRKLPGSRTAVPGQRILLSISAELQEFAERLLAENEQFRESHEKNGSFSLKEPWIRGGALVAMDPYTGEILALASYPRIDPNDFIPSKSPELRAEKQKQVRRWLENEMYISEIWDGKRPLERERFNPREGGFYNEILEVTWNRYLEAILPEGTPLWNTIHQIADVGSAYKLQKELEHVLSLSAQSDMRVLIAALYGDEKHTPSRTAIAPEAIASARAALHEHAHAVMLAKQLIDPYLQPIPHHDDKLLVVDLCRLIIPTERISSDLLQRISTQPLSSYRSLSQSAAVVDGILKEAARTWFHQIGFQEWRETHFKEYLKLKRQEEKEKKQYTRPYTEYLEQIERIQFKEFWETFRWDLTAYALLNSQGQCAAYYPKIDALLSKEKKLRTHRDRLTHVLHKLPEELALPYLQSMRSFDELSRPLYGTYRTLRHTQGIQLEKHLAAAFYPPLGYGYGRSEAFRQSTPSGSVFKLLIGYQGLLEKYQSLSALNQSARDVNPLTLVDKLEWTAKQGNPSQVFGHTLDGQVIKRYHKGGRLPRSHPNVGKIDLIGALEQSSNLYFPILAAEYIESPQHILDTCRLFGFGERTGIELPGEIRGFLPDDLSYNLTGLYSFSIGQHSLVVTPLQTAVMMSAIANQGDILEPKIVQLFAGNEPSYDYQDPFDAPTFAFQEPLNLIGIDFPLFTATQEESSRPQVWHSSPTIKRSLFMPDEIRDPLIEGMRRVIAGPRGTSRPNIIRLLYENPEMRKHFYEMKNHIIGKTGTAEIMYKHSIDAETKAVIRNHISFAGISFTPDEKKPQALGNPELVVVVYLRFSESGGKEAAPLAVEVIKKWREICAKHGKSAHVAP